MSDRIRVSGHKLLEICTTTIKGAGAHISTGRCLCGWSTEETYNHEVRAAYRRHLLEKQSEQLSLQHRLSQGR